MEYESAHLSDAPVRVLFFLMRDEHLLVQELADAQEGFLGHGTSIQTGDLLLGCALHGLGGILHAVGNVLHGILNRGDGATNGLTGVGCIRGYLVCDSGAGLLDAGAQLGIGVGLVLKLCRIVDGLILDGRNKNFVGGFAEALFKVNGDVDIDRGIKEDTQMEYLRATVDGDYQFTTKVYIEGAVAFRGGTRSSSITPSRTSCPPGTGPSSGTTTRRWT